VRALAKARRGRLRLVLTVTDASGATLSATASKRVKAARKRR